MVNLVIFAGFVVSDWGARCALLVLLLLAGACADPGEGTGTGLGDDCIDVEGTRSQVAAQGLDPDDPGAGAPPGPTLDPERTVKTLLEGLDELGRAMDEQGRDARDLKAPERVGEAIEKLRAGGSREEFRRNLEGLGYPTAIVDVLLYGGEQLVVYRRSLPAMDDAIRQRADTLGVRVTFADAPYSYRYLAELAERILSGPLRARYRIEKTMTEPDGSGVQVVTSEASRAREPLRREYGPAVIVVEPGP